MISTLETSEAGGPTLSLASNSFKAFSSASANTSTLQIDFLHSPLCQESEQSFQQKNDIPPLALCHL